MPEARRLRKADCADYGVFCSGRFWLGHACHPAAELDPGAQAQVDDVGFDGAPGQEHLARDLPVGEASAMSRAIAGRVLAR